MSGDYVRWLATESAAALKHDSDDSDDSGWTPDSDGFCITGCPDDVCRMSGHCAWPASGPETAVDDPAVSPGKAGE